MADSLKELTALIQQLDREKQIHRLKYYKPYPKQLEFHNAQGRNGLPASEKLLMGGNQIGKTFCGGAEMAMHLTGMYPDWYKGPRFLHAIRGLCASVTNELTRDKAQSSMLGDPENEKMLGTGWIPIDKIGKTTRKPGVPNAYDNVSVKHVSGKWSRLFFRCYEQGGKKFMSVDYDVNWCDEEPPPEIWSQVKRSTFAKKHYVTYITATPEEGMTEVVTQFVNDLQPNQALVTAGWDDAQHMTDEMKEEKLKGISPHERDMRTKGVPLMGAGLIFPFSDDELEVDPFEIPKYWPQIIGIDFGFTHPFGAAKLAWDREADVVYVTACYHSTKEIPAVHAITVKAWGEFPVAWPADGIGTEKGTGKQLYNAYKDAGLKLLPSWATHPPKPGEEEGKGGTSVEAGILDLYTRMESGRLKVFRTCRKWFEEKRMYHRDQKGQIVKLGDDVLSATRYAHMMLRHARLAFTTKRRVETPSGIRNW